MKIALIFLSLFALTFSLPTENLISASYVLKEDGSFSEFFGELAEIEEHLKSGNDLTATLNEFADKLFVNVDKFISNSSLDPYPLPDQTTKVGALLTLGTLKLTKGSLNDLSTIHRGDDVVVQYDPNNNILTLNVPLAFNDLAIHYHYSAKFIGIGPSGGIEGAVKKLKVKACITFDFNKYVVALKKFDISCGSIIFNFSGNVLVDWIFNLLNDAVTLIFKNLIIAIVESVIRDPINQVINTINSILSIFGHSDTAPELLRYMNSLNAL